MQPPARALAVVVAALAALPLAAGLRSDEVLPNGLRVILIEHRANPMICSSVIVGAGVVHEPEGMNGASHFLEHLLFNGTESRSQRELYDEVDRWGAYNNATTREDHTLFTLLIQREFADRGLEIQSDMLFHSTLPPDKFEKEKGIVLEELAKDENDPSYVAGEAFRSFAYAGTPLARAVLGTEASIRGLERDRVYAYYRGRYVPENMTLVVAGDFESEVMMATIRRTFGAEPRGKKPRPESAFWPDAPKANLAERSIEGNRTYVFAAFPLPSLAPHDAEAAAVELLLAAAGSGADSPLARALTGGPDPKALSFSLELAARQAPWTTVEFQAVVPKGSAAGPVLDAFAAAIRGSRPGAPAWDRIGAAASVAKSDEVLTSDQIQYYAMTRSAYVTGSPRGYLARRVQQLASLGDDPLERARSRLVQGLDSVRAIVVGPGLGAAPATWKPAAGPAEAPVQAARSVDRRETLPSGLELWVRRNDDSRVFAAHLLFRPRSASEPAGKEGIADFLHRMMLRGTVVRDAAALSAAFDALGAKIKLVDDPSVPFDDYYTTPEFSFARLEMPADRWREGLSLLAETVRFPRLADEDVETVRRAMLDLQARQAESTRAVAAEWVSKTLAPGHPLASRVIGTPASIASITAADLRAFHQAYVTGRRAILTVVGPVDASEMVDAVKGVFGSLPAGDPPPVVDPPPVSTAALSAETALGKGQAYISVASVLDPPKEDQAALAVAGAILSDRLSFRLREERGLAYSMAASVGEWGGRRMRFEAVMGTRQANVEDALAGLREGIAAFGSAPPDAAAVERAANALRGRLLMRRMTRINQAYFAGLDLMAGRSPGDALDRVNALGKVTAEDIARVVAAHLDLSRCATVVVR